MISLDNIYENLGGYLILFYNGISGLFTWQLGGYFILFFIMAEVGNLDTYLGGYFSLFL